jgi:hypothetical protein
MQEKEDSKLRAGKYSAVLCIYIYTHIYAINH